MIGVHAIVCMNRIGYQIKTPPCNDMCPDYWCPVPLIYLFGDTLKACKELPWMEGCTWYIKVLMGTTKDNVIKTEAFFTSSMMEKNVWCFYKMHTLWNITRRVLQSLPSQLHQDVPIISLRARRHVVTSSDVLLKPSPKLKIEDQNSKLLFWRDTLVWVVHHYSCNWNDHKKTLFDLVVLVCHNWYIGWYTLPRDHLIQDEIPTWVCSIGLTITQNYNFELSWNFISIHLQFWVELTIQCSKLKLEFHFESNDSSGECSIDRYLQRKSQLVLDWSVCL